MRKLLLTLLAVYRRRLSPLLGPACRFEPTCSRYASACIARYGVVLGMRLALARLLRCREPWPCGQDPVPEPGELRLALRGKLLRPSHTALTK